jgi:hypothetical protein
MLNLRPMDTAAALATLVLVTVVLAVAGAALGAILSRRKQRARFQHYLRAGHEYERSTTAPTPLQGGITPEMAAAIRRHAEKKALVHWQEGLPEGKAVNPYDAGTPEHVLWYASYELALHELADAPDTDVQPEERPTGSSRGA